MEWKGEEGGRHKVRLRSLNKLMKTNMTEVAQEPESTEKPKQKQIYTKEVKSFYDGQGMGLDFATGQKTLQLDFYIGKCNGTKMTLIIEKSILKSQRFQ